MKGKITGGYNGQKRENTEMNHIEELRVGFETAFVDEFDDFLTSSDG
nr:hypothetical protein [[Eubacterium] cellulosolvens]